MNNENLKEEYKLLTERLKILKKELDKEKNINKPNPKNYLNKWYKDKDYDHTYFYLVYFNEYRRKGEYSFNLKYLNFSDFEFSLDLEFGFGLKLSNLVEVDVKEIIDRINLYIQ